MDPIIIFSLIVLLFSVVVHELAHGYVALSLGDLTAKYARRLTLNPIKHLDFFGSFLLPLILIVSQSPVLVGWAKPMPVNPYNFKDQKWGSLKVALAGPLTNIFLALFFGLLIRFAPIGIIIDSSAFFSIIAYVVIINLVLAVFNLLPIPPLDGHWILFKFLPLQFESVKIFLQQYGIFLLILFLIFGKSYFFYLINILAYTIVGENWIMVLNLLTQF